MSDIYLIFPDQQTATDTLTDAGYQLSDYNDMATGNGWGPVLQGSNGIECNLYDCSTDLHESLQQYVVPPPKTPNNVRAGDEMREYQQANPCVVPQEPQVDL